MPKKQNTRQIRALINRFGTPSQAATELRIYRDIYDVRTWTWQRVIDAIRNGLADEIVLNVHFPLAYSAAA